MPHDFHFDFWDDDSLMGKGTGFRNSETYTLNDEQYDAFVALLDAEPDRETVEALRRLFAEEPRWP